MRQIIIVIRYEDKLSGEKCSHLFVEQIESNR